MSKSCCSPPDKLRVPAHLLECQITRRLLVSDHYAMIVQQMLLVNGPLQTLVEIVGCCSVDSIAQLFNAQILLIDQALADVIEARQDSVLAFPHGFILALAAIALDSATPEQQSAGKAPELRRDSYGGQ